MTAANWLAQPLEKHFPHLYRKPSAAQSSPKSFIKASIDTLTMLVDTGLLTPSSAAPHRAIHQHLIAPNMQQGRTEIARQELDWSSIWKWVAKIKGREGELVWDFNHNQLATKSRLKSLHLSDDDTCSYCNNEPETDEHLMLAAQPALRTQPGSESNLLNYELSNLFETPSMEASATALTENQPWHSSGPT